ncbi:hypothetical protein [Nonomuraea sp. NPDC050783]|uniref:hypothetical protein n=1 Tax=Nonomuraea sp. NPDC050783 TaxID=3154634 RepID=UPI0034654CAA
MAVPAFPDPVDRLRAAVADAQAGRERAAGEARELRERLAVAQAAAGLVLPELIDLSRDLGDGVRGVTLPEAGITVARQPDGAVLLHAGDLRHRLGDAEHAAAHARALDAALLAVCAR